MESLLVDALVQHGPLGISLAAVGYAFWKQSAELREVQAARVEDAKKVIEMIVELADKQHEAIDSLRAVVVDLKNTLEHKR